MGRLYRKAEVEDATGVEYRMLDYWVRQGVLRPAIGATGSGSQRWWTAEQLAIVRAVWVLSEYHAEVATLAPFVRALETVPTLWGCEVVLVDLAGRVYPWAPGQTMPVPVAYVVELAACRRYVARQDLRSVTWHFGGQRRNLPL